MSTGLSVYQKMSDPVSAVQVLGKAIAKSGMFSCANESQGEVFAWECMARNQPPLMMAEDYHVIFGKLAKKADAMLGDFLKLGGKHKIISRTPDLVSVEMTFEGSTQVFSLSWEDAQLEPFCYVGKESDIVKILRTGNKPLLKDKYSTPRSRMQMLWARTIGDAIRTMNPQACRGVYTPEELSDMHDNDDAIDAEFQVLSPEQQAAKNVLDDVVEVTPEPPAAKPVEPAKPAKTEPKAHEKTIGKLYELAYDVVGTDGEKATAYIKQHLPKGQSINDLTEQQASELITQLRAHGGLQTPAEPATDLGEPSAANIAVGESQSAESDGPATDEQVKQVKALLVTLEQQVAGTTKRFSANLAASGRKRIAELTFHQCQVLIEKLKNKDADNFFKEMLTPKN